ncbi:MAG: Glucose/arabinose dehydrogenase, beta-propeller fold [Verrucomicrobiales bacterium]|nr:Glucose/arabinose dehydrogenase, beta-propeller fold [Verrucomicrobiales bacterium]
MKMFFWIWCLSWAAQVWAGTGTIQMSDGKKLDGEIKASCHGFTVSNTNGQNTTVDLKQLSRLQMHDAEAQEKTETEGKVHGLTATYFNSKDLTGPQVVRIDPTIDFDWQEKPPMEVNAGESFSVRWEGEIEAPLSEKYTFYIQGNDQMKLWVNNKLIISGDSTTTTGENQGTISLEGGKRYQFKLEFYEKNWSASAKLFWSSSSVPKALVAPEYLYTSAPSDPSTGFQNNGLLAIYFNKPNLTGDYKVRVDPSIDFDWEENPPIPGFEPNQYSVRWEGDLIPELSEQFTFEIETEDCIRFYLNEKVLLESVKGSQGDLVSAPVELKAGEKYHLRIELVDASPQAGARFFWSSTSISRSVIPASYFVPAKPPPLPAAKPKIPAGLVMTDGSVLAFSIQSADNSSIAVTNTPAKQPSLSSIHVARILLQPLQKDLEERIIPGRVGLLLCNKDFVDGEFKQLGDGQVQVTSILFGIKQFERGKVMAIILRDSPPPRKPSPYVVKTKNGSRLQAQSVDVNDDSILIKNPLLAEYKVPMGDLLEIEASAH